MDSVETNFYIQAHRYSLSFPLLFSYSSDSSPYSLQIEIWDQEQKLKSITIDQIRIKSGGLNQRNKSKEKIINCNWKRDLQKKVVYHHQKGKGRIGTEMMTLSDSIENVLDFHQPCTITLSGQLKQKNGTVKDFRFSEQLIPTRQSGVATFYELFESI